MSLLLIKPPMDNFDFTKENIGENPPHYCEGFYINNLYFLNNKNLLNFDINIVFILQIPLPFRHNS